LQFSDFYIDTAGFVIYSSEHFWGVFAVILFGVWFLYMGKYRWNEQQQWRNAIIFSSFLYGIQLFKALIRVYLGNFEITTDLPLELCNIIPLLMIIALWKKSRMLLSIIFFWIMAGTIQANITPTLLNVFPHYEWFRYWWIHAGLPVLAIYSFYVLGFRYNFRDIVRSALAMNIVAAVIYLINITLDANYLYLVEKPPAGTIYDLLGPWPWYIVSLELSLLVFFSTVLLPFRLYSYLHDTDEAEH
jgi:hypothetical integral membrane protein (TIGR02206 family)|tara:strand:+ start:447 stop:1181 length:735 start_codon:yes stop_codon:yes gene_type:complete